MFCAEGDNAIEAFDLANRLNRWLNLIMFHVSHGVWSIFQWGSRWRSGRASNCKSRGPGFDPHKHQHVVSLSKTHELPTVLVKPRKSWLHPDMAEKLLTGMLSLNTNKQTKYNDFI